MNKWLLRLALLAALAAPALAQIPGAPIAQSGGGGGGGGSGTVTSVATACGTSGGPIVGTGTVSGAGPVVALGDLNSNIASTTTYAPISVTLTAARTYTLPTAASYKDASGNGCTLTVADTAGGVTSANTATIAANGSDNIAGASTFVIAVANGGVTLKSDGVSAWAVVSNTTLPALTNHQTFVASSGFISAQTIPDCQDSGGNHLNFKQSNNSISCGTSGGAGGGVVPNYITGLIISNDAVTSTSLLDISAGTASDSTNAASMTTSAFTKSTGGAWAAGSGSNGMGNGLTIASATQYYVCEANNAGTPDFWFDTSVSCANRPAGISDTKFRLVNAFHTCQSTSAGGTATAGICAVTSTNIAGFTQIPTPGGVTTYWQGSNITAYPRDASAITVQSASRSLIPLSTPAGLKTTAMFNLTQDGVCSVGVTSPSEADFAIASSTSSGATTDLPDAIFGATGYGYTYYERITDTSSEIAVRANAACTNHITVFTRGWRWDRGINGS